MDKPATINVIIIDPFLRTIMKETIPNTLEGLQHSIGDHHIELIIINDDNIAYVDEEGLFREGQEFFVINGEFRSLPIAGKAVVLGNDQENGESIDVKMNILELASMISFHSRSEMRDLSLAGKF